MFPFPDCLGVEGTTQDCKARRQRRKRMMLRSWRDALERQLAAIDAAIATLERQMDRDGTSRD
jgi:hypothetical protein